MKLKGSITLLVNRDNVTIEIEDKDASTRFLAIELTPEQFMACLSRQAYVKCDLDVRQLDRIGKKHENKSFTFPIDEALMNIKNEIKLADMAQKLLDKDSEGWIADAYFRSQDSFPKIDGVQHAKCTIRRWV